ncbi:MAG: endothelin-converting protein [Chryseobacterium sp. SCN 40-13]|nr:MAG: endothelin-converting protein [Chryseobacterium sp. SCN 40-13]
MKKSIISILALSGIVFFHSCTVKNKVAETPAEKPEKIVKQEINSTMPENGLNLEYMDTSVRPQDDFFSYVNGNWYKTTNIPSDRASWGSFNKLREDTDNASLNILNAILSKNYDEGTEGQKIQNLYGTFMDWNKRNAEGLSPVKADFAKIDAIKSISDLQNYLNGATRKGNNPFYSWRVGADLKNSVMNAVYLNGPSLGLGKDYYQKVNEANTKTLAEYTGFATKLYQALGYKNAGNTASQLVKFEKELANYLLTNEQGRDANLRYNPKNVSELPALVKNINLPAYLKSAGVATDRVIIGELKYYQNMDSFINSRNLPLLKDYMKFHLLRGNMGNLDKKMDDLQFDFYSKYLQGQQEQRPMDKRGLQMINSVLGEAFGKLYVEENFSPEAKAQMETYINYLRKAFSARIDQLDWMSPETKVKAQEKLSKFNVKIAYPDQWRDYSKLVMESPKSGGTLYQNMENLTAWHYQRNLAKIGQPVDKKEWAMSPQTVNAYYSSSNNEIVFPAAILQPPFFNFKADPAVNFGGIGAVIGHEISHGFDDGGSRFDGDGNLKNWWTDADRKNFDAKVSQLAAQYDEYEPVKGSFVNGKFTSGENIGDLGGVAVAYEALQMYLKDHGNPGRISGFSQDQRFFMSWATVWRTKSTDQYVQNQVKTDPHSPGYYRAFAPLLNINAFHEAFNTQPGDAMYKKPEERISIW